MSDLDEIQRKQADATRLALKMVDEKDPERLKEMAAQVLEKTKALEKAAKSLAASAAVPDRGGGEEVRVLLTSDQKERLAEQTGVGVEAVTLRDSGGRSWNAEMPTTEPRVIEKLAAEQAAASRLTMETRKQVEAIIKQLKALNVPELEETIRELERDPTLGRGKKSKT
jgi:hypothetical protein